MKCLNGRSPCRRHETLGPPQAIEASKRDAEWKIKNYYSAHSFAMRVSASTGRQSQWCKGKCQCRTAITMVQSESSRAFPES